MERTPAVILVIALTQFALPFMYSGVALTLPSVGIEFSASAVSLALIETVYLGAGAAFLLPMGRVAETADMPTLFKTGLLIYTAATLAVGYMPSIPAILAVRFVQGIASALMGATAMALLFRNTSATARGRAIGVCLGAVYAGLAAGPFFAGVITTHLGWRWVYFLTAIPLFLSFLLVQAKLSGWRFSRPVLNWRASGFIVAAVFLLIFGCALLASGSIGYLLLALAAVAGAAYYALDRRSPRPMLELDRLRENPEYGRALLGLFAIYAAGFGMTFLLSLYLQLFNGFTPQEAGIVLMISPCVMAVVAPFAGRLADRFPPQPLASLGALCVIVSLLMATQISIEASLPFIVAVLMMQGLGFALFSAPNMSQIMHSVKQDQLTMASALSAKMRSLGMVASMAIVTICLAVILGAGTITGGGDYVHGMMFGYLSVLEYSFVAYSVIACCAALLVVGKFGRASSSGG